MSSIFPFTVRALCTSLFCFSFLTAPAPAQQQQQQTPPPTPATEAPRDGDEVIRVSTDLVQTDVMVFDKQGRFVEGLPRDQFELRIDGKPQEISFFERINAGSVDENAQLAAARGGNRSSADNKSVALPLDRRRIVYFFIDDMHLSISSAVITRKMLLRFVDEEMGQNDEVAITSASGQIGFLQQLTNEKTVLRAAVARLNYRAYTVRDVERPSMSEYQALAIERRDNDALAYFIEQLLRDNPFLSRESAESMLNSRARNLLQQAASITTNVLSSLESLMRSSSRLPGRKLVFFISDGFHLDTRNSTSVERLRRITDAAARSGVVIYTMDAKGLTSGLADAGSDAGFDPTGRLSRVNAGALSGAQEPLRTLAADTGGRALLNTNALDAALAKSLKETSVYYLLAWQPEAGEQRGSKFKRIEVRIKDRPELNVQVRRGFFTVQPSEVSPSPSAKKSSPRADTIPAPKSPEAELVSALYSPQPRADLPTSLSIGYLDSPEQGVLLTASVEIEKEALNYGTAEARRAAKADIACVVFNDQGKPAGSLRQELTVVPETATSATRQRVLYSNQFRLPPGLYQVRVGARDRNSGRTGSAAHWIVIPDLKKGFSMSSLFVGERSKDDDQPAPPQSAPTEDAASVVLSADRRFSRASWLRFVTYIYNAVGSTAKPPDVGLQVQVFRDDQPVITSPLRKVNTTGVDDLARIPYAAELSLNDLAAGRYVLQITAIDRAAKASTSQRVNFFIE